MNAPHVEDRLADYLEGDLTSADFADVAAHLADCADCSEELLALRRTIALVRGLPDPQPPADFAASVMQRIAADAAARRSARDRFRRIPAPVAYTALAAGTAALVAISTLDIGLGRLLGPPSSDEARVVTAEAVAPEGDLGSGTESQRRLTSLSQDPAPVPSVSWRPRPMVLVSGRGAMPAEPGREIGFFGSAEIEIPLRDLDGELDAALANPAKFLERVRRTSAEARRPLVAPLIAHSARRGDGASFARTLGSGVTQLAVPASTSR